MSDVERAMLSADDAELLNRVCAGDTAAFGVLYQRHERAARWLARDLVVTADEVDGVVAETFEQLLQVTRRGSGPADAFRPYLLTALRRVCDRRREESLGITGDDSPDPAAPYLDLAVASLTDPLIVRAFLSLPERWMAVLWHTEIEGARPAEVGPLLGLSRNGVAALRRRAKEGLTQAYLQMYISGVAAPDCTTVAIRLGAFIRDAVSGPDSARVTEHLSQCDGCRAVFAELSDVSMPLRAMVAPVFLGDSAAYYLSRTAPGARASIVPDAVGAAATETTVMAEAAGDGADAPRRPGPGGQFRGAARPRRWLAVGSAAVIVLGGAAVAFAVEGHGAPLKPAGRDHAQAPASLQAPATVDQSSATPARSKTAPRVVRASASHTTSSTQPAYPRGSTSPARPPSKSPPAPHSASPSPSPQIQLTAAVDVHGGHHHSTVVFQVNDTGSAGSKELIVSVALPAGSSFLNGHGHGGGGNGGGNEQISNAPGGQDGWSCKATSSGARCQHDPIQAGSQSQGVIFISVHGSSACGQTVSITAASGSGSASAQSPERIQC